MYLTDATERDCLTERFSLGAARSENATSSEQMLENDKGKNNEKGILDYCWFLRYRHPFSRYEKRVLLNRILKPLKKL